MAERFIAFEVFGCFEVPVDGSAGQRFVDHQRIRDFWKHARLGGLADERGCYVFALRTGRGIKPLYVGKAAKGFAKECFQERNQLNLARGLRGKQGTLVLFLVKYVHKGRGSLLGSDASVNLPSMGTEKDESQPTQKTPGGMEIPVPKRREIMDALRKLVQPVKKP